MKESIIERYLPIGIAVIGVLLDIQMFYLLLFHSASANTYNPIQGLRSDVQISVFQWLELSRHVPAFLFASVLEFEIIIPLINIFCILPISWTGFKFHGWIWYLICLELQLWYCRNYLLFRKYAPYLMPQALFVPVFLALATLAVVTTLVKLKTLGRSQKIIMWIALIAVISLVFFTGSNF